VELLAKHRADPESLTPAELSFLVNELPHRFRTSVTPAQVVALFDAGALSVDIVRQCSAIDLNGAVRSLCAAGDANKAARLVDRLVALRKANQHTFAMFFDGCAARRELSLALGYWVVWAKVRGGAACAHRGAFSTSPTNLALSGRPGGRHGRGGLLRAAQVRARKRRGPRS